MSGDLDGRVAVVTGAARGIGRAVAERFGEAGATVVGADVNREGVEETAARIEERGGTATGVETDVTDSAAVDALIETTASEYGGLDVVVANAGGSIDDRNLHRVDDDAWRRNVELNLTGTFYAVRAAVPAMAADGGGSLVLVSSVNGLTGIGLTAYSSAKSGLFALSRTVATQYGRHGIRSNVVCPGTIATGTREEEMTESGGDAAREAWLDEYALGRFGRPGEVAEAALFLASDRSSFVTGTELVVDGGLTAGVNQRLERTVYDVAETPTRAWRE